MSDNTARLDQLRTEAQRDGVQQLRVSAIVQHDGKVLLLRQPPTGDHVEGEWEIPVGTVDSEEDLYQALARVIRASVGLDLLHVGEVLSQIDYTTSDEQKARQLNFLVQVLEPDPIELTDHDAYTWTGLVAETPLVTEMTRKALADYSRSTALFTRQHRPQ
ncbi:NUDIX domain-containing protein [Nocardia sp. CS682]|uniref:NUDIX domain-containing protein n=1 Tax=Nocardia sp. CS682 TaxID=1047172 RepID=UPI001074C4DF|nr:NUDIX domain-containing protein [Nocardia sp. CS682]QBS41327.1 DNA mismatch repair protein MutT [Nocardia sp. CS682]